MGTRQTKGSLAERASPGAAPGPRRERPDFWASLLLRAGDKAGRAGAGAGLPPYHRRVGMVQELLRMVRQGRREEAGTLLQHLRQEGDALGAMEKLCRQLTYHLSPHSQWRRHRGLVKRKPQACLKAILAGSPPDNTVDLSGIPLTSRDLERVTSYLQRCGEQVDSVELGFTGLTDDMVLQLLPALSTLPRLTTLALNGNRLTRALLRDLTDTLKDPSKFPSVTWIDLGNNVDIFSLPQPFLLSLRKRSPKQGHLPTILELGEGPGCGEEGRDGTEGQEDPGGGSLAPAKDYEDRETVGAAQT
ncbi:leucine-rich repeat-containing protein 75A isoform X2 [Equus quagga]|uniref:Leucine-rich repeat-containing protein 75A isoform X1 n=1 Tax=Equus przewalskii TaxID=9798 RepID=A0ABM4JUK7_EQUPR|nr:leucine-rich repeat-containing protein 75A isoform X2 [Equus caballus]XP_044602161.1 leucine-rich repeat-containing protein 75A isoform X2 [Equus asinus]XP_046531516.1 leucine-rich repeat-containing protein 75A isoform X2 [Equus quagga]